jgi:hypothetical protein
MKAFAKFTVFSATLLILAVGLFSCEEKEEYPQEILFTEYSLDTPGCRWVNLPPFDSLGLSQGGIIISGASIAINSNEELENHIACTNGTFSEIDFSKHTLLLIWGMTPSSRSVVTDAILSKVRKNEYRLNLEVLLGPLATPGPWYFAILVPKIHNEPSVKLNVTWIY